MNGFSEDNKSAIRAQLGAFAAARDGLRNALDAVRDELQEEHEARMADLQAAIAEVESYAPDLSAIIGDG